MANKIALSSWERAEHFAFFKSLTNPYFSVCVRLDVGELYSACKKHNHSFYLACLFACMRANNTYTPITYRIKDDCVWQLEDIAINAVQLDQNNLFKFTFLPFSNDFNAFCKSGQAAFDNAKRSPFFSEQFGEMAGRLNCFHVSVLPWLDFSSFSHATPFGDQLGIPKLVLGKFDKETGTMALNIDVHHGLMDGFHVAQFINVLNKEINQLCDVINIA
jgi:chloramphenicol O-acetyltransferase type A